MIDEKILKVYQRVEDEYHQKFGEGYLALVDPLHPREKDYLDGIKAMKSAIRNKEPLPNMAEGVIY